MKLTDEQCKTFDIIDQEFYKDWKEEDFQMLGLHRISCNHVGWTKHRYDTDKVRFKKGKKVHFYKWNPVNFKWKRIQHKEGNLLFLKRMRKIT